MTLAEIESSGKEVLTPKIVAEVLGCDQQLIRLQARLRPELLGFPVILIGNRVKIPTAAFLRYMRGETGESREVV